MLSVTPLLTGARTRSDSLRYGRRSGKLPSHLLHYSADKKPVVVWTSTRRCNLHCMHCYTDSNDRVGPNELDTSEAMGMVEQLAAFGCPVLLISGGEPLARGDVFDVAERAVELGMRVVFSTNGTLIQAEHVERFTKIGVSYVGISIDGRPATHDKFRGQVGAFEASMAAVEACGEAGLRTGLRFTLTKANQGDLPWLLALMEERKVPRLCVYHLAPSGRGARIGQFAPTGVETRAALDLLFDHAERSGAEILTADNHADNAYLWMRVADQQPERADEVWELLEWNGGNQSGQAIACIDSDGTVYPDQFWRWQGLGNVREEGFEAIWATDPPPLLRELRDRRSRLPERCQGCRFVSVCNGNFRSRAEAMTGDRWGADPFCYLSDEEIASVGATA